MDMRIPPLRLKIMLESNPSKSIVLVRRLAVRCRFLAAMVSTRIAARLGGVGRAHIYIYIYREREMYVYIYIYIYRERERGVYIYIYIYIYLFMYTHVGISHPNNKESSQGGPSHFPIPTLRMGHTTSAPREYYSIL